MQRYTTLKWKWQKQHSNKEQGIILSWAEPVASCGQALSLLQHTSQSKSLIACSWYQLNQPPHMEKQLNLWFLCFSLTSLCNFLPLMMPGTFCPFCTYKKMYLWVDACHVCMAGYANWDDSAAWAHSWKLLADWNPNGTWIYSSTTDCAIIFPLLLHCLLSNWKWLSDRRRRRSKGEEHESARLKTLHQCNFKMQVLQKVCVKQLNQKNVRLLAAAGGVVGELRASLLRNSKGRGDLGPRGGRRGGREGGTAGRKVPPLKQWTLPAENKYNTTDQWQVLLQRLQNTTKTRQRRSSTSVISGATNVHNTYQFNHHLADSGVIWLMEGKTWVVVVVL